MAGLNTEYKICGKCATQNGRFTKAQNRKFFHTMTAQKKLLRKRNSDHYRELQQRFTKPQTGLYTIDTHTVITDFEKAATHAISTIFPNAQRRMCRFHLGQSWWHRIQTLGMSEDYRQELGYFEVVGVVFRTVVVAFG